ncbi:ribosomal protein S18-alanine N-acetyltransferase [bacterium]|jgi:ribosomal-protein-alanine N-acetyltransferase|nr:ribosomal protein S18-alanine N-acetyltransferase [bacterium]MBT3794968.1 ribosomal protein S18-alanine N-acetyltransferase [bacterium]MBT4634916.1 ribosomal protein S18-alanine N-acetyltransferase [bacterium]
MGSIRKIDFNDLEEIYKLEKVIFSNCWSDQIIKNQIKHPKGINLLVNNKGQILGYLFARDYIDFIEIERIGVEQSQRRNYIAEKLIKELETITSLKGIKRIVLEVRVDNYSAIKLYKKHGFKDDSIRKNYYEEDGQDAVLMSKRLD